MDVILMAVFGVFVLTDPASSQSPLATGSDSNDISTNVEGKETAVVIKTTPHRDTTPGLESTSRASRLPPGPSTKFDLGSPSSPPTSPPVPPRVPPLLEVPDGILYPCDQSLQMSCNYTNFERCVLIRERSSRCVCLAGYARGPNGFSCLAVRHYRGALSTQNPYTDKLLDRSSSQYRKFEFEARQALFEAAMQSRLRNTLVDVRILGFTRTPDDKVMIQFEILLPRPYSPLPASVMEDLSDGILYITNRDDQRDLRLANTDILVSRLDLRSLRLLEPNPCDDPLLNYCHKEAVCNTTTARAFACTCRAGYDDVSPNRAEAPGEKCQLRCDAGPCLNGGVCVPGEDRRAVCRCSSWFIGNRCQVNGQDLLIALCVVIGGIALIGIIICSICLCYLKRQGRRRVTQEVIPARREKHSHMPRSWYDTWRYHNFASNYPHLLHLNRTPTDHYYPPTRAVMIPRPQIVQTPNGISTVPPRGYHNNKEWTWDSKSFNY